MRYLLLLLLSSFFINCGSNSASMPTAETPPPISISSLVLDVDYLTVAVGFTCPIWALNFDSSTSYEAEIKNTRIARIVERHGNGKIVILGLKRGKTKLVVTSGTQEDTAVITVY